MTAIRTEGVSLVFDPRRREVRRDDQVVVAFGRSRLGYRLLEAIAVHPGLAREALYEQVWEMPHRPPHADNAFHVALNAVRKKLGGALVIERVGGGYALAGNPHVRRVQADGAVPSRPLPPAAVARWATSGTLAFVHPLMGRAAEGGALAGLLEAHRVAAVVGPGGIGKTRLANDLLAGLGRVRRSDVSNARDAEALREHLASLLEVPADKVGEGLARLGACTVLLDDVVAGGVEGEVRIWLRQAPELRVVLTSRRRMALPSVDLGPLSIAEGAALMADRLGRGDEGLHRLSERLGAFPLLLELAIAPLRLLGAQGLLDRLGPELLERGVGPERHRALRNSVAFSLEQMAPADRAALRGCAVFAGAFSLEAAEVVLGLDLPCIDRLVEHHLLRLAAGRLSLWPLVREVLGPPAVHIRRAHLEWIAAAARRHADQTRGPGGLDALDWLEGELANLVEAFEYGLDHDVARAIEIAWSLDPLLERRGFGATRARLAGGLGRVDDWRARIFEGRTWRWHGELDRAARAFTEVDEADPLARGHKLLGLAGIAVMRHRPAVPLYERAVEAFDEAGEAAMARRTRALVAPFAEDSVAALRDVLAEHRACADLRGAAIALGKLAGQHLDAGSAADALVCGREAQELSAVLGDNSSWAVQGGLVALAHHLAGDLAQADAAYVVCIEALEGSQRVRSRLILELNRGLVGLEAGRAVREDFHRVRHGAEGQGATGLAAAAALGLALVELSEGQQQRAKRWLSRVREVTPQDRLLVLVDAHLAGADLPAPRSAEERVVARLLTSRSTA